MAICSIIIVCAVTGISSPQEGNTPKEETSETFMPRAYFYLASRITWGPIDSETIKFCVSPNHSLFDKFSRLDPTTGLRGKKFTIKTLESADRLLQQNCDVIALTQNAEFNRTIIKQVQNLPVLTISHEDDITVYGGIIYVTSDQRLLPPKINIDELENSNLHMDASILAVSLNYWDAQHLSH